MKQIFSVVMGIVLIGAVFAQPAEVDRVVDSIYAGMSVDEKIGQLFMIRAHSNLGTEHEKGVEEMVRKYHVGGLCFFQGTPAGHARLINRYQEMAGTPLMIAMDAEWGGGMRFKESAMNYPRQLTLGAIQNNELLYRMGLQIGHELRDIGVHINFAPVVDVNVNPANPVINDRSFGEDRYNVTAKGYHYMKGLQDAGVMACAKHFPGHGDTDVDSHLDLPVIRHTAGRLDSIELYPFRVLVDQGVQGVMVAHLHIPAYDNTEHLPTTLSPKVVDSLLRRDLGFDGLVFTDALEMKGVTKHFSQAEIAVKALTAGNDVLLLPENLPQAFNGLKNALENGFISEQRLEQSVKRILKYKATSGIIGGGPANVSPDAFPAEGLAIKAELYENALTAVANGSEVLPITGVNGLGMASLVIGTEKQTPFQDRLGSYADFKHLSILQEQLAVRRAALVELLGQQDIVIIGLMGFGKSAANNYGIDPVTVNFIRELESRTEVIVVFFGSPYMLGKFEGIKNAVVAYEGDPVMQDIAAQGIFGAFTVSGKLPVSAGAGFPLNAGYDLPSLGRLGYAPPERVGMSTDSLDRIAAIVDQMIGAKAAPGCQILVARKGKIIYNKAFGHQRYSTEQPVACTDLYDIASVTKIAATTVAAMKLFEEQRLFPGQTLHFYLDDVAGTNKEHLVITDLMAHQAGLQPWIPFYENTVRRNGSSLEPLPEYYREKPEGEFTIPVANDMFLRESQRDSIWKLILDSPVRRRGEYKYSDLGFYMLAQVIERQTGKRLDAYCDETFYGPLGMKRTLFLPLQRFSRTEIAPTEEDQTFRKQRLQGHVHDSNSAMLGGVGGHAGLFSNAESLAILLQMLLNGGTYGGQRYLNEETISYFTKRVEGSTRRSLGFDMRDLNSANASHTSSLASEKTYGHTGFTGTCVWNDPESELIYIFLSNRTYPSSRYNTLAKLGIREQIHDVVYRAIVN